MWTRSDLKSQAKLNLKGRYWVAFAVTIIVGILGGGTRMFSYQFSMPDFFRNDSSKIIEYSKGQMTAADIQEVLQQLKDAITPTMIMITLVVGMIAFLAGIAFSVFVSSVVQVGGNRWFSRNRESGAAPSVGMLFDPFKAGSYLKTVGGMVWMNLFLFLWGLLPAIPSVAGSVYFVSRFLTIDFNAFANYSDDQLAQAIAGLFIEFFGIIMLMGLLSLVLSIPVWIKSYSYRLTPWILADNPAVGYRRALQMSKDLTRGNKWGMFVLDLSFIGWWLLGFCACCIGMIFVVPYIMATQAELYHTLRAEGVSKGLCTMEELGYVLVSNPAPAAEPSSNPYASSNEPKDYNDPSGPSNPLPF